jgi:hypothetical protein
VFHMAASSERPSAIVDEDALDELRRAGFTCDEISDRLGVSTSCLRKWRQDNTREVGFTIHVGGRRKSLWQFFRFRDVYAADKIDLIRIPKSK